MQIFFAIIPFVSKRQSSATNFGTEIMCYILNREICASNGRENKQLDCQRNGWFDIGVIGEMTQSVW